MVAKMIKAQFKIQQMSFMLLAVFLFFILVALFWLSVQYRNLYKQATQLEESKSIEIAAFLSGITEFSCSSNIGTCIDTDKIIVFGNRKAYSEFWPVSYIKIRKIGEGTKEIICNKANYPDCNVFDVYENPKVTSKSSIDSFVALCRHERIEDYPARICELGKLIIGYEIK